MTFGELAFIDHSPRSANVTALETSNAACSRATPSRNWTSKRRRSRSAFWENLALGLTGMLRQANRELAVLK